MNLLLLPVGSVNPESIMAPACQIRKSGNLVRT